jgi:hypothetical protein
MGRSEQSRHKKVPPDKDPISLWLFTVTYVHCLGLSAMDTFPLEPLDLSTLEELFLSRKLIVREYSIK